MSYRKIVTVVDEHTGSTVTAGYAMWLAKSCSAELVLYCALPADVPQPAQHAERHLSHLEKEASLLGVAVTRVRETGAIEKLLPATVRSQGADLLFYSLSPGESYGAYLQRQTVHQLLRSISCDLAIVRVVNLAKPHPRHILMPVSKSASGSAARQRFITAICKGFHSQITLLHLFPTPPRGRMPQHIDELQELLLQQQVAVLARSAVGRVGSSITVEAIARHSDLIVLGHSERGLVQKLLYGNPAAEVLHHPPCNAILFRGA